MGNSFGCSASGERLVSAARDGDLVEARALLNLNPLLAKYSTFGALNSPLHFASAKGHNEIVNLLLENGADANVRNYCGQTALMQASRFGHWEVVQTLILHKANVSRADYLNRRTAFHFAAVNGHTRCIRLLVSDYIPSMSYGWDSSRTIGKYGEKSSSGKAQIDKIALSKLVNKAADGGITALHLAALYGHPDCVHLLLDLFANASATTFHYGSAIDLIGAGSTPLHYAACGGNLHCCQVLISKGASRTALNCNGWVPWDVARVWGRHWLESLLSPHSQVPLQSFPISRFLSLPLMSILKIAREDGLHSEEPLPEGNGDHCAVCLESTCTVAADGCGHELCTKCALYLCSTSSSYTEDSGPPGSVPCPLCRHGIVSFIKLEKTTRPKEGPACSSLGLCTSYPQSHSISSKESSPISRVSPVSAEIFRSVSCTRFSNLRNFPSCICNEGLVSKPVDQCSNVDSNAPTEMVNNTTTSMIDLNDNIAIDVDETILVDNIPGNGEILGGIMIPDVVEGGTNMEMIDSHGCLFSVTPWRCNLMI